MEIWNLPSRNQAGREEIMSQITLPRLPQAPEEYNASQINQLVTSLDQLIRLLNSSYTPEQLRNDDEAVAWFIG